MKKKHDKNTVTASEFDRKFEEGEDITQHLELSNAKRGVLVDLPSWVIGSLDREAARLGITRQALIKVWLVGKVDELNKAS